MIMAGEWTLLTRKLVLRQRQKQGKFYFEKKILNAGEEEENEKLSMWMKLLHNLNKKRMTLGLGIKSTTSLMTGVSLDLLLGFISNLYLI